MSEPVDTDAPCFCPAFNYDDNVHTVAEHRSCGHMACGNCDDCDSDQIMFYTEDDETDLSSCPYFNGTGICSFGCWDEPRCHTCEPANGWPSQRSANV